MGVGDADGGDPILFRGEGADATPDVRQVGVDLRVLSVDRGEEGGGREVAEVFGGGVVGGVGADEERTFVAVGTDEQALAAAGAGGDGLDGEIGG